LAQTVGYLKVGVTFQNHATACWPGWDFSMTPLGDMETGELLARLLKHDAVMVVDVRSAQDFTAGHLPGAINISYM